MAVSHLARWIRKALTAHGSLEIDGLGTFTRAADSDRITFRSLNRVRIFIAYAREDGPLADRLYRDLQKRGYAAWLDRKKLLPGQNWPRRIEDAIAGSDFVLACFSTRSVRKRGGFQAEIRYALDCARRVPLDEVFLIPLRLDECPVPLRIQRETQYVDLFPDWQAGFARVVEIIERKARKVA
jgi:hypothetical protein